jgi:hypothetical protein
MVGRFRDECKGFVWSRREEATQLERYVSQTSIFLPGLLYSNSAKVMFRLLWPPSQSPALLSSLVNTRDQHQLLRL